MTDELTPIAQYMRDEMANNAAGDDVRRMRENNSFSGESCIAEYQQLPFWRQLLGLGIPPDQCINMEMSARSAALISWGLKVRQDGDWDHKPIIAQRFHPRNPTGQQHWHLYNTTLYYYDVWSNIHYGYVGKAAGFSDSVLLDGAGLEQIGSTLLRFSRPQRDATTSGLRAWDDPSDRAGIEIGINLYRRFPTGLTTQNVLDAVLTASNITKKPFAQGATGR
ncbi:MAG TPA: polymorphic toxin type 44 domain-containing protein [Pyrinomonadaceae bacterium]|nr:polymorphic toxin type 44 domain-containing protein [Pyrinomonadaceae bacterium]